MGPLPLPARSQTPWAGFSKKVSSVCSGSQLSKQPQCSFGSWMPPGAIAERKIAGLGRCQHLLPLMRGCQTLRAEAGALQGQRCHSPIPSVGVSLVPVRKPYLLSNLGPSFLYPSINSGGLCAGLMSVSTGDTGTNRISLYTPLSVPLFST